MLMVAVIIAAFLAFTIFGRMDPTVSTTPQSSVPLDDI